MVCIHDALSEAGMLGLWPNKSVQHTYNSTKLAVPHTQAFSMIVECFSLSVLTVQPAPSYPAKPQRNGAKRFCFGCAFSVHSRLFAVAVPSAQIQCSKTK